MRLDEYQLPEYTPKPRAMVAIADATWIGGSWILVIRDPHKKENVYMRKTVSETTADYQMARIELGRQGFTFVAIVGDGRMAIPWAFSGIPFQMCHFHQLQIVARYTTLNPKLPASIELLALVKTLSHTDSESFRDAFSHWCRRWDQFLKEKSVDPNTGRSSYTHRRLRSARDSIKRHLPFLFTHEKYPEFNIPNTTNSLDGNFKKVKIAIGVHSGLTHERKLKLIKTLLRGRV
jgi:hypothetical protein